MALSRYRKRRDFARTPEPTGAGEAPPGWMFVVQRHWARREHFDFRLELDGVLKSWAVPKGPSLNPEERRLAVHVEDHPIEYGDFEGVIPPQQYGAGTVLVWDTGVWIPEGDPRHGYEQGHLTFRLEGRRLRGRWHLVRSARGEEGKESWLLIKSRDEYATGEDLGKGDLPSALTGRTKGEIAQAPARLWTEEGEVVAAMGESAMPAEMAAQLATLVERSPEGSQWLFEIKLDGYRMLTRYQWGQAQLISRNGKVWTERFRRIAQAFRGLRIREGWFDGEVAVVLPDGTTNFQALQNALDEKSDARPVYFLFDLLWVDGEDLRERPLAERKARLKAVLEDSGPETRAVLRFTDHVEGEGDLFFEIACRNRLEGIMAKRADRPWRAGRGREWLKIKCLQRQEFVIGGYTDPKGGRFGFGALLLGLYEGDRLHFVGRVGTGFTEETLRGILARLKALEPSDSPFVDAPKSRGYHWVRPELVAEVAFSNWTDEGLLRQPAFQGLREDKPAREVVRESPAQAVAAEPVPPADHRRTFAGVRLSNPDKILYPGLGITKRDIALYYERIEAWIVPELAGRPLTLLRCPEGHHDCFFQKHANDTVPPEVHRITLPEKGKEAPYMMVDSLAGVMGLVQMGVLEIHVRGVRLEHMATPDRMVFDLDPGEGLPWGRVVEGAHLLRAELVGLGLIPFLRTTGGKGLHVVVPLTLSHDWQTVKSFSKAVAQRLARSHRDLFTASVSLAARPGKVYVDYVRNSRGATAVASYSTRARPGAPVATPLEWDELVGEEQPVFTIRTLPIRLAAQELSPWADIESAARGITPAMWERLVGEPRRKGDGH